MKRTLRFASIAAIAAVSTMTLSTSALADTQWSAAASNGEMIHGSISSVGGRSDVYVRDDRGYVDHIVLHDGTVINPTGSELAPGESVTISGQNAGRVFRADEIDSDASSAESNGNDANAGGQNSIDDPSDYGNAYPYDYGYGYSDYGNIYFGGGYYGGGGYYYRGYHGGGYHGGGYSGHASSGAGSFSRGSFGRGGASASFGRGGSSGGSSMGGGAHGGGGGHR